MSVVAFSPPTTTGLFKLKHATALRCRRNFAAARRSNTRPTTVVTCSLTVDSDVITSFAEQVKGEWVGYEGNFHTQTGKPLPVPDFYIPEEFSQWDLTPLGFESNHSIIVRSDKLYRKFFRVLPTVSLFADHVDAEEDFRCDTIGDGLSVFADGSFVNGANKVATKKSKLERAPRVEFRLPHPFEERQAAHITLQLDFERAHIVQHIRAVLEKWSCIYCDGADMDGSSGYVEGWVVGTPGSAQDLTGVWRRGERLFERTDGGEHEGGRVFLPEGLDVAFERSADGGRTARAAWRVGERRIALQRLFDSDGNVVANERFVEQRE